MADRYPVKDSASLLVKEEDLGEESHISEDQPLPYPLRLKGRGDRELQRVETPMSFPAT
jgi:hypothetical protein